MNIYNFIVESNHIEGIDRVPTEREIAATRDFILGDKPTVDSLCRLARAYAGNKGLLREKARMNVRVGSHFPPQGGPHVRTRLAALLTSVDKNNPYNFHCLFELLHPFLDGNGRTGRALWAWQMWQRDPEALDLGFLHWWYYASLRSMNA